MLTGLDREVLFLFYFLFFFYFYREVSRRGSDSDTDSEISPGKYPRENICKRGRGTRGRAIDFDEDDVTTTTPDELDLSL